MAATRPTSVQYTTITFLDVLLNNATNTIRFTDGSRWITVSGNYDPTTGQFTAAGTGAAAGITNVPATFSGTINAATGQLTGQVTLIGNANTPPNGLPGHSVTYTVNGTVTGATPGGPSTP